MAERASALHTHTLQSLIAALRSPDGYTRQEARHALVRLGSSAVPALIECLSDSAFRVRWEAAKALSQIGEASAAPALVRTLTDEKPGVRWLAAEALVALRAHALIPLLEGLQQHADSPFFRAAALQVLHALARAAVAPEAIPMVLDALNGHAPEEASAVAAARALEILKRH